MAAAYVLIRNRQPKSRERVFRDRINPLDYMDGCDILEKFRLPRHVIFDLCNELNDRLEHQTKKSHMPFQHHCKSWLPFAFMQVEVFKLYVQIFIV